MQLDEQVHEECQVSGEKVQMWVLGLSVSAGDQQLVNGQGCGW